MRPKSGHSERITSILKAAVRSHSKRIAETGAILPFRNGRSKGRFFPRPKTGVCTAGTVGWSSSKRGMPRRAHRCVTSVITSLQRVILRRTIGPSIPISSAARVGTSRTAWSALSMTRRLVYVAVAAVGWRRQRQWVQCVQSHGWHVAKITLRMRDRPEVFH